MQPVEGAVIACAGLGSRLGMGLPKCLIEVGGRTILSRLVESLLPRVPRIHVVIGYREEMIADYCARHYRDVVLVRNPDFRETNTAHSLMLGSAGFLHKVLYLDGDLLIDDASMDKFIQAATTVPLLVGVTRAKSSQAVYATVRVKDDDATEIEAFHRAPETPFEWANMFAGAPALLRPGLHYVYECLEPHLPAPARTIELFEIDTPEDLAQATRGIKSPAWQPNTFL
jgi:choline kinase